MNFHQTTLYLYHFTIRLSSYDPFYQYTSQYHVIYHVSIHRHIIFFCFQATLRSLSPVFGRFRNGPHIIVHCGKSFFLLHLFFHFWISQHTFYHLATSKTHVHDKGLNPNLQHKLIHLTFQLFQNLILDHFQKIHYK